MQLTGIDGLGRAGLQEFQWLHPLRVEAAGQVQLAYMKKYPGDGIASTRRWVDVPGQIFQKAGPSPFDVIIPDAVSLKVGVQHLVLLPAVEKPSPSPRHLALDTSRVDPFYVPVRIAQLQSFAHENGHGLHFVAEQCQPLLEEVGLRIKRITGERWSLSVDQLPPKLKALVSVGISEYAAQSGRELVAEALTDWNLNYGRANEISQVIGSSVDRFLSVGVPGAIRLGQLTAANPFGGASYDIDDVPEWQRQRAELAAARESGRDVPWPTFQPLDLSGSATIDIPGGTSISRTVKHGFLDASTFDPAVADAMDRAGYGVFEPFEFRRSPVRQTLIRLGVKPPRIIYDGPSVLPEFDIGADLRLRSRRYEGVKDLQRAASLRQQSVVVAEEARSVCIAPEPGAPGIGM